MTSDAPTGAQGSRLLETADELYGLRLAEFTPARDARAKQSRGDEAELSLRIKRLRKPSTAAWAVNLLVRHASEEIVQVLAVGAALREAQESLAGDDLRALTRQRRQLTAAVAGRARALAAEQGQRLTGAVSDQVEATLTAAILDDGCARALRSGLLVVALASTGVDGSDPVAAVALPEALGHTATPHPTDPPPGRADLYVVRDPEADTKVLAAATERVAEAQQGLDRATESLAAAAEEVAELEARSMQVQAEIDELRLRVAELEARSEEVDDELGDAEDVRSEAEDAVATATAARDAAAATRDRLA